MPVLPELVGRGDDVTRLPKCRVEIFIEEIGGSMMCMSQSTNR
jgi:hypothetical protein